MNYFPDFIPDGITKIYGYSRLIYKNIYHNIDEEVYSNALGTKLYFICEPGSGSSSNPPGNPNDIEITFRGATAVNVNADSSLSIITELGTLTFTKGYAYEDSSGIIVPMHWKAGFTIVNPTTVKFNTGIYNNNEPLIIRVDKGHRAESPNHCINNLCWSTLMGGKDAQEGKFTDITHDDSGRVYATGWTSSGSFPVTNNAVQKSNFASAISAVVVEFSNSAEDSLLWATYYGGGNPTDYTYGTSIGVDTSDNIYITGYTNNALIAHAPPPSPKAYVQPILMGNQNIFIAEFDSGSYKINWFTYYGGAGTEQANHLVMDNFNKYLYIVGSGATPNTPLDTEVGAYNNGSPNNSGLILKFSTDAINNKVGKQIWGTLIGSGIANDSTYLSGCAVDANGNFFITGNCNKNTYPVLGGYSYGGDIDAIVTGFNAAHNAMFGQLTMEVMEKMLAMP